MSLLPIAEAQARLLALTPRLPAAPTPIAEAAGRWAAEDVVARRTQPGSDLSVMDGYAIRHADLPGPWRVIGESAAGRRFAGAVDAGEAVRIFTGAAMPPGADCVLVQEEATREDDTLTLSGEGPPRPGANVRPLGLDFAQGDTIIAAGDRLTPARIALATIAGVATISVPRRVSVDIASTGDELQSSSRANLDVDMFSDSNSPMLAAQLAEFQLVQKSIGPLPDRLDALTAAFSVVTADVLITTGGASVGDHDLVKPALEAAGARLDFWRVALRPGKPMLAGVLPGGTVVVGLPGNPVSAFVTCELFVKPLIAHLSGAADPLPRYATAILDEPLPANGPRTDFMRGRVVDGRVTVAAIQDSSMLRALARSNCLVVRDPHAPLAAPGDTVTILPIA